MLLARDVKNTVMAVLRAAKHQTLVIRRSAHYTKVEIENRLYRSYSSHTGYTFSLDRHRDARGNFPHEYFLDHEPPPGLTNDAPIERVIYCFWTGTNPMSDSRASALQSLQQVSQVPVILVTPENLDAYVLPDAPLHPSYEHLSLVMRSDYLRAYFMHFHGGGYSDIKNTNHSWVHSFERIDADPLAWVVGYTAQSYGDSGGTHG